MKLLVLASGRGSRLKHKTSNIPKTLVKIKNKPIFEYLENKFTYFDQVIIVAGYKYKKIKKYKTRKVKIIYNSEFSNTNMVHSLFKASKYVNSDIIITYADIIFSKKIIKDMIKKKISHIPVNNNWLNNWKKRMSLNKIYKDAENLETKKNKILAVGGKIKKKLPKFQYMGLIKLKKNDYVKLFEYYKKINNKKIDMTSFLSKAISNKVLKLGFFKTKDFWTEIDCIADIKAANKMLNKTTVDFI